MINVDKKKMFIEHHVYKNCFTRTSLKSFSVSYDLSTHIYNMLFIERNF